MKNNTLVLTGLALASLAMASLHLRAAQTNLNAERPSAIKWVSQGNRCELVSFESLGHAYNSSKFGAAGKAADQKTYADAAAFLTSLGLLPVPSAAAQK